MSSLKNNYAGVAQGQRLPIFRPLTLDGTVTGDDNMNVNGSVTPVEFYIAPASNQIFTIDKVCISLTDTGNPKWNDYGGVVGPLTNGVSFFIVTNGVEIPLTPVIKTNVDFMQFCANFNTLQFASNVRLVNYAVDIGSHSSGLILDGTLGDRFGARVRDDLSTLVQHKMELAGSLAFKVVG